MRITRIILAVAFAAFAVASWAKYDAASKQKITFADRWATVDEAVNSGAFRQQ
jgi:hypothetical protein